MKTLIIVDMQDKFSGAKNEWLIEKIVSLVETAIHNGWPIVVLEYKGCGQTLDEIMKCLGSYSDYDVVEKQGVCGADQVLDHLSKNRSSWPLDFAVCGIYGDACVAATVNSLLSDEEVDGVDVVTDAIVPGYPVNERLNKQPMLTSVSDYDLVHRESSVLC